MEVFPVNPSATYNHGYMLECGCLRGGEEHALWHVWVLSLAVWIRSPPYQSNLSSNDHVQCIA